MKRAQPSFEGCGGSVSRILSRGAIPLGPASLVASSNLPAGSIGPILAVLRLSLGRYASLFGFAPWGVYHARPVTSSAVGSYPTLSPLPDPVSCFQLAGHRRFALCCTFHRVTPPRYYLAHCPAESGLSSTLKQRRHDPPLQGTRCEGWGSREDRGALLSPDPGCSGSPAGIREAKRNLSTGTRPPRCDRGARPRLVPASASMKAFRVP